MRKECHLLAGLCLRVLYHEQAVAPSSFRFAADPLPAGSSWWGEGPSLPLLPSERWMLFDILADAGKRRGELWHGGAGARAHGQEGARVPRADGLGERAERAGRGAGRGRAREGAGPGGEACAPRRLVGGPLFSLCESLFVQQQGFLCNVVLFLTSKTPAPIL